MTWDRLAEICAEFLGKGALVALDGRIQTRQWEDENKLRHWKTEIVASSLEMLSGRRKKDYEAQQAADSLAAQAEQYGEAPPSEPIAESAAGLASADGPDDDEEDGEADASEAA